MKGDISGEAFEGPNVRVTLGFEWTADELFGRHGYVSCRGDLAVDVGQQGNSGISSGNHLSGDIVQGEDAG